MFVQKGTGISTSHPTLLSIVGCAMLSARDSQAALRFNVVIRVCLLDEPMCMPLRECAIFVACFYQYFLA